MGNLYCTTKDIENEIKATTSFSSSTYPSKTAVLGWIEQESDYIDSQLGTSFESTSVTDKYFDYDGSGVFRFPESPLVSVDSVSYNENNVNTSASWISLEEGFSKNYLVYEDEGEIVFINGDSATNKVVPKAGKKRLKISYTYGYSEVPSEVVELCTLLVVKRIIRMMTSSQANKEGGSIQVGTIKVTSPNNFSVNYIKNLNNDIEERFKRLGDSFKVFRNTRIYD